MYLSKLFTKTTKESSSDAESANADLLTRGGFIFKNMAGVYTILPLGLKVLSKIERILREEMDKVGSEMFMSALSPSENWEKTGRKESVSVLFQASAANSLSEKLNDAHYILNSTHEELVTPAVARFCGSYQDFPTATYQIQTKYRNEARPKSGLLRCREFRMKDLYSFHTSEEDMNRYFREEADPAYQAFFERVGLGELTERVWASGGDFSAQHSLEFQTRCATGEDLIFINSKTGEHYNREIAECIAPVWGDPDEAEKPREDVVGKGIVGVDELAAFLKIEVERTTKTLLYQADDRVIAVAVRGGYDVNEEKVRSVVGCSSLALASADVVEKVTGAKVGYAGPIGLPDRVEVYWDDSTQGRKNFECGANVTDEHTINANFGRDVEEPSKFYDLKVACEGDICPDTGGPYETYRACEVGNLFTLYTKFSDAFDWQFVDKEGKEQPVYMGCYGIGTTRTMGVLAEVFHDEHGLLWPAAVAPAQYHIVPLSKSDDEESYQVAEKLYQDLTSTGKECIFDDRLSQSTGSRLADADLIGCPVRLVVSKKSLEAGGVEVKERKSDSVQVVSIDSIS